LLKAKNQREIIVTEIEPVTVNVVGGSMMSKLIRSFLIIVLAVFVAVVVTLGIHRGWTSIAAESDAHK
jgi:hypothetical protein